MDKFDTIVVFTFIAIFAIIGIAEIIVFIMTLMWHFLLLAAISAAMVWVLYDEDFKSKNKKLSTLWQKKNTKN